jgi:predicted Zn-dependent peptidase
MANAFTGKENTCYHARALAARLPDLCDLLTDLLLNPALDPEELERERQVILQEICSVEDAPDELVHVLFSRNYWSGHPLGSPVLGTAETVSGMDREAVRGFMRSSYLPDGLVAAAVGDFEHERLVDLLAEALGGLEVGTRPDGRKPPEPCPGLHVVPRDGEQAHLLLGYPAPSAVSEDRFKGAVLNLILGGNMSSRLFQEVREKRGLAYAVYSFQNTYSDSGLLAVYAGVAPGRAAEALRVVQEEISRLALEPVSAEELSDAKDNLVSSILLASENPDTRMTRLARNEYNFGRAVPIQEVVGHIEAVTIEDVAELAASLLDPALLGVTVLGPVDQDAMAKGMLN